MIRGLRFLGVVLGAVLTLGVAAVPGAAAAEFHSAVTNPALTGEQPAGWDDLWIFDAGIVECKGAHHEGALLNAVNEGKTATTLTVAPSYKECTSTFGVSASIHPNGCHYVFHTAAVNTMDITCAVGKSIEVTVPGCVVTIPAQAGLQAITYVAVAGPPQHVKIEVNINGLAYVEHNKGVFPTCKSNTVNTANGSFISDMTMQGFNSLNQQKDFWWT